MNTRQQHSQYNRDRMRNHRRPGLQLRSEHLPQLTLHPGSTQRCPGFIFERIRKINNRAAAVEDLPPVLASAFCIRSKKRKIHALELLRADTLNESNLVFQR